MKLWIVMVSALALLAGCGQKDPYSGESTGSGGAGPGYDGTGSGPAATNVNDDAVPEPGQQPDSK